MSGRVWSGVSRSISTFLFVGFILPLLFNYLEPTLQKTGLPLQPQSIRWTAFIALGASAATFEFLSGAFERRAWPWLVGKLGSGVTWLLVLSFLSGPVFGFALGKMEVVHSSAETTTRASLEANALLFLLGVLVVLSFSTPIFQFLEARQASRQSTETSPTA